jgi:SHAQKYF class myb-like DNA-binding protein
MADNGVVTVHGEPMNMIALPQLPLRAEHPVPALPGPKEEEKTLQQPLLQPTHPSLQQQHPAVPEEEHAPQSAPFVAPGELAPAPLILPLPPLPPSTNISPDPIPPARKSSILSGGMGNQGRWTEAEHELFLEGLREHGKGAWKLISEKVVRTRSAEQVRIHAQKYFLRQSKQEKKKNAANKGAVAEVEGGGKESNGGGGPDGPSAGRFDKAGSGAVDRVACADALALCCAHGLVVG